MKRRLSWLTVSLLAGAVCLAALNLRCLPYATFLSFRANAIEFEVQSANASAGTTADLNIDSMQFLGFEGTVQTPSEDRTGLSRRDFAPPSNCEDPYRVPLRLWAITGKFSLQRLHLPPASKVKVVYDQGVLTIRIDSHVWSGQDRARPGFAILAATGSFEIGQDENATFKSIVEGTGPSNVSRIALVQSCQSVVMQFYPTVSPSRILTFLSDYTITGVSFLNPPRLIFASDSTSFKTGVVEMLARDVSGRRFVILEDSLTVERYLTLDPDDSLRLEFLQLADSELVGTLFSGQAPQLHAGRRLDVQERISASLGDWLLKQPSYVLLPLAAAVAGCVWKLTEVDFGVRQRNKERMEGKKRRRRLIRRAVFRKGAP